MHSDGIEFLDSQIDWKTALRRALIAFLLAALVLGGIALAVKAKKEVEKDNRHIQRASMHMASMTAPVRSRSPAANTSKVMAAVFYCQQKNSPERGSFKK